MLLGIMNDTIPNMFLPNTKSDEIGYLPLQSPLKSKTLYNIRE